MLRFTGIGCEKRQIDFGFSDRGELALDLFSAMLQSFHGHRVTTEINIVIAFEFRGEPVHDTPIEIISAQTGITIDRLHLDEAVLYFQN